MEVGKEWKGWKGYKRDREGMEWREAGGSG